MTTFNNPNPRYASQMDQIMMELQMKDYMNMFNGLTERCFHSCVSDFSTRNLTSKEETCMYRCVDKFIRHTQRVGLVFQEQTLLSQQTPEQRGQ